MAAISGTNGVLYVTAECFKVRTWSVDVVRRLNTARFGDADWGVPGNGLEPWTGIVEGQCSDSSQWDVLLSAINSQVKVEFCINETGTICFLGDAIVATVSPTTVADSLGTFLATLSGIEALVYHTS
jgi:hypothetical protein